MVNIGLVGFGFMGQTHWHRYQQIKDVASVIAVADVNPQRAKGDVSGTWGNLGDQAPTIDFTDVTGTTNWRDLLDDDRVDAIDICVPTNCHAEIAIAALQAGKHVLCEKPLTRNMRDAEAINATAQQSSAFLMPAMCMRFWPQWAWLKGAVSNQTYGRVLGATFIRQASRPQGWYCDGNVSGGAVLDLHIHDTDFVCHLFGLPNAVFSRGYSINTNAIDHICTQYCYDDIPLVVAEGGWSCAEPFAFRMRYTVQFDSGVTADFDLARQQSLLLFKDGGELPVDCPAFDGWAGEIKYFVDCIVNNVSPTRVTVCDAMLAMKTIEAESRSVSNGSVEEVA